MKRLLWTVLLLVSATPVSAQNYGPQPEPAVRDRILAIREGAWRSWFANDERAFREIVPAELVALDMEGGPWSDQAATIAKMRAFATSGKKLVRLEFPRNVFQQYGDVVILYSTFVVVLEAPEGKRERLEGRGTEIFVHKGTAWTHTGWHLDTVTR